MIEVSIVIPTYNRVKLLERAIESVLSQTFKNFELIVVDDASTDGTEKLMERYCRLDGRVEYVRLEQNTKGTKPRNVGIMKSKGKFIALLDSDDEWVANKLEVQLNFIKETNRSNVVCFTNLLIKENGKLLRRSYNKKYYGQDIIDYMFINNTDTWVQASTYMFEAELGKETLFDPELRKHQDIDFCLRLQKNKAEFLLLDEPLTVYHHHNSENRVGNNNKVDLSLDWIKSVEKDISREAYLNFYLMFVVHHLYTNNQFKVLRDFYKTAYQEGIVNKKTYIKGILKPFIPKFVLQNWYKIKKIEHI
jgi:glycosyltransferase involved in cell wall biosynthesis